MAERTVFQSITRKHVISLGPQASVRDAACVMTRANCGSVLIMDTPDILLGILTERDLMTRVLAKGLDPERTTTREIMTPNPICIGPEDARLQAVRRRLHLVREFEDLLARGRQAVARRQPFEQVHPEALLEFGDAAQHGRVVHPEATGGGPHRARARDGKEVPNVIPVDHSAIRHRGVRRPRPSPTRRTASRPEVARAGIVAHADERGAVPNG